MAQTKRKMEEGFYKTGKLVVVITRTQKEDGTIESKFSAKADRMTSDDLRSIARSLLDQSNEIEIEESMEDSLKKLIHNTKS